MSVPNVVRPYLYVKTTGTEKHRNILSVAMNVETGSTLQLIISLARFL